MHLSISSAYASTQMSSILLSEPFMADISFFFKSVSLPVMPEVAIAIIDTLDEEDPPISTIRGLIAHDPSLSAKLLALANSAAFGQSRGVATLDNAISLLGMNRVRSLALAACLHNAFSIPEGVNSVEFWRYSMACAGYAQWLSNGVDVIQKVDSQKAWLTGLMLRLGELIVGHASPQTLKVIERTPSLPGERWDREKELTGFHEGEVTAELGRRWNFPNDIIQAVTLVSNPMRVKPMPPLAGVLHLSGLLADVKSADATTLDILPVPVMSVLGLRHKWMMSSFPKFETFVDINQLVNC